MPFVSYGARKISVGFPRDANRALFALMRSQPTWAKGEPKPVAREAVQPQRTLGDVVYPGAAKRVTPETDWSDLVRRVAAGNQPALHALYERAHRPVFILCLRICASRETAEELTVDVFHDVWRRASTYDPENGCVLGWIMNQARSRAIDRQRFDSRKKRLDPGAPEPLQAEEAEELRDAIELKERGEALHRALASLGVRERDAIETAFFAGLTHAEAAARLALPLGTLKTRIRSGLARLRKVLPDAVRS
jgi:RNA polymerase sigma-70 factor, ECF subfamily